MAGREHRTQPLLQLVLGVEPMVPQVQIDGLARDGAEQGRRKSPPEYCAMAKQIAEGARAAGPGVGIDIPPEVARAARLAGISEALASKPDVDLAGQAAVMLREWALACVPKSRS